ncbi:MAG: DNA cytosine methyltransferase [Thermomicrobiales bacterium]
MRVISLFSGAGGMDLGFTQAGHDIVWANDIFADAVESYRRNLGDRIHLGSIEDCSPDVSADIVIGGFPCQGFSVANWNRNSADSRNQLYRQMLRVIKEVRPIFFVAENVKGILNLEGGRIFRLILREMRELGYEVRYALLNAADFGVPQRRHRVFIVGKLEGSSATWSFPPHPTHSRPELSQLLGLKPWVSVGEALAQLPEPGGSNGLANHEYASRYKLRFNGHLGHRVVDATRPAPTITARGDDRGGVVVIHHPSNERRITPREAATIQGFPLDFEFVGTNTSVYRQVANAVPPPLARAVAECLTPTR